MTVRISFPQPAGRLSMNDRSHWAVRSQKTQAWRIASSVNTMRTIRHDGQRGRVQPPCFVRVTFPVADVRRRDADNPAPTVKAIVDGLVDAGCWPDDTPEYVETLGSRFEKGASEVVVELIPRTGGAA